MKHLHMGNDVDEPDLPARLSSSRESEGSETPDFCNIELDFGLDLSRYIHLLSLGIF